MAIRILLSLLVSAALWAQPVNQEPVNREKEAALGARLANEVRQRTTPDSPELQAYVERLGEKLAPPSSGVTFRFTVVKDALGGATHEPLACPGGYIFVSASLLAEARDEAELAGMLAHAMAHITNHFDWA